MRVRPFSALVGGACILAAFAVFLVGCQTSPPSGSSTRAEPHVDATGQVSGALTTTPTVGILAPNLNTTLKLPDGATPSDPPAASTISVTVVFEVADFGLGEGTKRAVVHVDGLLVAERTDSDPFPISGVGMGEHALGIRLVEGGDVVTGTVAVSKRRFRVRAPCA